MRRRARCGVMLVGLVGMVGLVPGAAVAETPAWTWPLAGPQEVSRPFDPPATRYSAGHRGADLPGEPGSVVRAAGAGRVSYAGLLAGRGVVVVVHGDLRTTYEPVTASVAVGASVVTGDQIGWLDGAHAGCPAAACLHWGLRRGEDYLDPVRLVDREPARLLPLGDAAAAGRQPQSRDAAARFDGSTSAPRLAQPPAPPARLPTPTELERTPAVLEPPPTEGGRDAPAEAVPTAARADGWSLRAAEAPLGLAALAALVAGIGLLNRPRPGPEDPAAGGDAAPTGEAAAEPDALVHQLDLERLRRRAS